MIPAYESLLQKCPFTSSPSSPSTEVLLTQPPRAPDCHGDSLCVAGKGIRENSYLINNKALAVFLPRRPVEGLHTIWWEVGAVSAQAQLLTKWWLDDMGLSPDSCQGSRKHFAWEELMMVRELQILQQLRAHMMKAGYLNPFQLSGSLLSHCLLTRCRDTFPFHGHAGHCPSLCPSCPPHLKF